MNEAIRYFVDFLNGDVGGGGGGYARIDFKRPYS